jgi:hypothetical protein
VSLSENSKHLNDRSNSYLNCSDIWNNNESPDTSKVFFERFQNIKDKKITSSFQNKKKHIHLQVKLKKNNSILLDLNNSEQWYREL